MQGELMELDKEIKCVVWDLDCTLWDGILSESEQVVLRPNIFNIIIELDRRGILQSIASKNYYEDAKLQLEKFGIFDFFLYPEIHWNSKSTSLERISQNFNVGKDTLLFIDDQAFEREEVASAHPEIRCYDAANVENLLELSILQPSKWTPFSSQRRLQYKNDIKRKEVEEEFTGTKQEFLASLDMKLRISLAEPEDLHRLEELTLRTNQLNATGRTFSYQELETFMNAKDYRLLVFELSDKFGLSGKIGLALLKLYQEEGICRLELLLFSCRVMSRGLGGAVLSYLLNETNRVNMKLQALYVPTSRNRMMEVTYRFSGFRPCYTDSDGSMLLEYGLSEIPALPDYIQMDTPKVLFEKKGEQIWIL